MVRSPRCDAVFVVQTPSRPESLVKEQVKVVTPDWHRWEPDVLPKQDRTSQFRQIDEDEPIWTGLSPVSHPNTHPSLFPTSNHKSSHRVSPPYWNRFLDQPYSGGSPSGGTTRVRPNPEEETRGCRDTMEPGIYLGYHNSTRFLKSIRSGLALEKPPFLIQSNYRQSPDRVPYPTPSRPIYSELINWIPCLRNETL